ncbi:uncharacterized protein [Amphiura filiformis]|uniref:uncharacterized protein isoform X1 n=1 Tax=Amphiura filiformis TaxID=82378 RepID=UPI003B228238
MDDSEEPPNPGGLQKARSLPRLNVEEAAEEVNAGHRYLTPQPSKRKPFIPPRPPANSFRRSLSSFSPRENGIPIIEEHEELCVENESHNNPSNTSNAMKTEHTHENERLEEAKRDLVATSGPLTPKRKAPQPPSNRGERRRKSDTNAAELKQLRKQQKARVKSLGPNQGLGTSDSDLSSSPDGSPTKKRLFYTPQPRRKQFNIDRDTTLDSYDVAQGSTRSPVERAAKLAMSKRVWGSSDSSDSTPSPVPQSVSPVWSSPRSPSSLSSQHSTSSSSTPSTTSPKSLPISPLASPLKVRNTQKSPLSGITWQSTANIVDETRPHRKLSRSRSSITPSSGSARQKPFRKATSGSSIGIQSNTRSSSIRKGKQRTHRSKSTATMSLPRSPDRSVDPAQSFGAAIQAEHAQRQVRRSQSIRDGLLNSMILNKTEPQQTSAITPAREEVLRTSNNVDQENTQLINRIARQKSGIEDRDGVFIQGEPQTPGSSNDPSSPSSGYVSSPSPTSSPRHRPALMRHISSVSSTKSMKSIFGSREVLNELFLSERGTNKGLKAVAGIITGLILGVILLVGLYYGLDYGVIPAVIITAVSTVFMSVCLAFTVRGRCVALLMVPTLCTQRGRAAFLAIVVALLLNGPINNIFINANEVSTSMSCSAELAYNQSQQIKEVAAEVFDQYVKNLEKTVTNLQDLADGVQGVFQPIENGLDAVQGGLNAASDVLSEASRRCRQVITGAYLDCTNSLNQAYRDCKRELSASKAFKGSNIEAICEVVNLGGACKLLRVEGLCEAPALMDQWVDDAARRTLQALQDMRSSFEVDVDFSLYWAERMNTSRSFASVQEAVEKELDEKIEYMDLAFSIANKLLALSVLWLCFQSYQYHMKYRTKDRFDNFYVTKEFKKLDAKRKEQGRPSLLPLKKSEKVRLIDLTQFSLSKPEKGLFKLGLLTVIMHSLIAGLLILIDYALFALLALITRHGQVKSEVSAEHATEINVKGNGAVATFIQRTFIESFEAASKFNSTIDSNLCLPKPTQPNEYLSIAIGSLYLIAILTVLFQAYALRLRRRIAAFFYPERELERLYYLYNHTLHKRQSLANFLQDKVKQHQHELEASRQVSFMAYLAIRYPRSQRFFKLFGMEKRICLGCASEDEHDTYKQCATHKCPGRYCFECFQEIAGICSLCEGIIEEACEEATLLDEVKKPKEDPDIYDWHYKYYDQNQEKIMK